MSFSYPQSEFTPDLDARDGPQKIVRPTATFVGFVDEDLGQANPLLGFMIAIPLGAAFWTMIIGLAVVVTRNWPS